MENFLCIDTISSAAGITVIKNEMSYHEPIEPMQASEELLKKIDSALKKLKLRPDEVRGILVIEGPGSFTGLRVGIAVANQFAHQLKIPIVGIKTEEWWKNRTEEKDFLYLQSMNRGEVYVKGFKNGKVEDSFITPIEMIAKKNESNIKWLGELTWAHRNELPEMFEEIIDLSSIEETWGKVSSSQKWKKYKDYELVEPFYGKAPNITVSKRKLS